jgi:hypothetical protein|tara:strand:+ start:267 stop:629 length:363 start_codon:yes stop_codon:yes gene_type:complete
MKITEIVTESVVQIWSRTKGGKMVRKYRCTAGPRKGRVVSSPSVCTQPKKISGVMAIKKAKARYGSSMKIKRSRTKKTAGASIRVGKMNRPSASRSRPNRRSVGRKTFKRSTYRRKPIKA